MNAEWGFSITIQHLHPWLFLPSQAFTAHMELREVYDSYPNDSFPESSFHLPSGDLKKIHLGYINKQSWVQLILAVVCIYHKTIVINFSDPAELFAGRAQDDALAVLQRERYIGRAAW